MGQIHKAGEKLFVDYVGQTVMVDDPRAPGSWCTNAYIGKQGFSAQEGHMPTHHMRVESWHPNWFLKWDAELVNSQPLRRYWIYPPKSPRTLVMARIY